MLPLAVEHLDFAVGLDPNWLLVPELYMTWSGLFNSYLLLLLLLMPLPLKKNLL